LVHPRCNVFKIVIKWPFFTETRKVGSGKNPKSGFFSPGLEVHLKDMFLDSKHVLQAQEKRFGFRIFNT
jgi:hypothetical protein